MDVPMSDPDVMSLFTSTDALGVTPVPDTSGTESIIGVQDSRYIKARYQPTQEADNAITGFENFIGIQGFKKEA